MVGLIVLEEQNPFGQFSTTLWFESLTKFNDNFRVVGFIIIIIITILIYLQFVNSHPKLSWYPRNPPIEMNNLKVDISARETLI